MGAQQHRAALGALSRAESRHPLLPALAAQGIGIVAVGLPTLVFFPSLLQQAMLLAMLQGGIAAIMARALQAPSWWLVIHIVFMPLVVGVRTLDLPAWTWPTGLILLLLVFWRTDRGQVPLYLSSRECVESVLPLLPSRPCRVIDLGCGDGALLRRLARARPDSRFVGVEHAPLPWLWAWLAGRSLPNLMIVWGSFWSLPLDGYDLVYAYLSPAPMSRLWAKATAEMSSGALLVSNSFAVPERMADSRIAVSDRAMTYFYVYRPAGMAV